MNHMLTQPPARETARRGRRRARPSARLLAGLAAAAVAAGAGCYAITTIGATGARPSAVHHPQAGRVGSRRAPQQAVLAAKVLRAAAARIAQEGTIGEPSPGQWIYYRTVDYGYPGLADPAGVGTDEEWTTFDGTQTAYYQDGAVVTHTSPVPAPGPGVKPWDAWNTDATPKTAYDVLASLPASPQALLAVIAAQAASQNGQNLAAGNPIAGLAPKTEAQRKFDYLTLILWNAAVGLGGPPAAEADAYRALSTLPGITVEQGIKDTAGRPAIGVSDDGGYDQLLIDPVSYHVIGLRQLSTGIGPKTVSEAKRQHGPAYPAKGTVIEEIIYAQTTAVPAPGDR